MISPLLGWGLGTLIVLTVVAALFLPISVHIKLALAGNEWRIRSDWYWLPGRRRRLRFRWQGCWNADSLQAMTKLRQLRSSRWSAFLTWAPWSPLLIPLHAGSWQAVKVRARIGTSDAASTAALAGLTWTALGAAVSWASHRFSPLRQPPEFHVQPVFQRRVLIVRARCIAKVRARDAIIAFLWLVSAKVWVRLRRETRWRDTGIPSKA